LIGFFIWIIFIVFLLLFHFFICFDDNFSSFQAGLNFLIKACFLLYSKKGFKKIEFFLFFSLLQINIFLCFYIILMWWQIQEAMQNKIWISYCPTGPNADGPAPSRTQCWWVLLGAWLNIEGSWLMQPYYSIVSPIFN